MMSCFLLPDCFLSHYLFYHAMGTKATILFFWRLQKIPPVQYKRDLIVDPVFLMFRGNTHPSTKATISLGVHLSTEHSFSKVFMVMDLLRRRFVMVYALKPCL